MKMKKQKQFLFAFVLAMAALALYGCGGGRKAQDNHAVLSSEAARPQNQGQVQGQAQSKGQNQTSGSGQSSGRVREAGNYTAKEDVALYLHTYHKLPGNFITKKEAGDLGWPGGSLEKYAPGKCIGGDRFGNYENRLPAGKTYYECDIDTLGASQRGAKRIVYTKDGDIYYTQDHYETFEKLY